MVPTRNGRHGLAFTDTGRLNLRNAGSREDSGPISETCECPACRLHSRAYLHHLLRSGEHLGSRLVALHNLAYYMNLLAEMRAAIEDGRLEIWQTLWRERYASGGVASERSDGSSDATDSAA